MSAHERPALQLAPDLTLPVSDHVRADLKALGVELSAAQWQQLGSFLAQLLAVNEIMNLTAITDPEQAWHKHIYDALTLLPLLPNGAGLRLIDIGSGGGVPGIPLAIARPDMQVTLVESTGKKAEFLRAVVKHVGLSNVKVEASRAEQLHRTKHARAYDVVTARAVARLTVLAAWTAPFAKKGGRLLLIKGQQASEELNEAKDTLKTLHLVLDKIADTPTGRIVSLRAEA